MKHITACIVGLATSIISFSQQPYYEWLSLGAGMMQGFGELAVDSLENTYVVGNYSLTMDFDPGPATNSLSPVGSSDLFISKYDSNGNYLWTKSFGGAGSELGYSIKINNQSIYCVGQINGTCDFNNGSPDGIITSVGQSDIFMLKLDLNGNFIWVKSFGGSSMDYCTSFVCSSNNIFLSGSFKGTADFDPGTGTFNMTASGTGKDAFILKLTDQGNFVWAKKIGASAGDDEATFLSVDSGKNIYCSGVFVGNVDFNPGSGSYYMNATAFRDGFILKLDTAGTFKWSFKYNSNYSCYSGPIEVKSDNEIYVCGNFGNYIDFNSSNPALQFNATNWDFVTFKMDSLGNIQWAKQISYSTLGNNVEDIAVDSLGNVYVIGPFGDSLNVDPGISDHTIYNNYTSSNNTTASFIVKFDEAGNFIWELGQYGDMNACGNGVALGANGNVYFTGFFGFSSLQASDFTGIYYDYTFFGAQHIFIAKIGECLKSYYSTSINQCGYYVSPSGNYVWSNSGIHSDTLANSNGCDSIITIDLTIIPYGYSSVDTTVCEFYISPNGQNLNTSGLYYDTLPNPPSCDSIVEINLQVNSIDTSVSISGTILQSQMNGVIYQWLSCEDNMSAISGANQQFFSPMVNGSYAVEITNGDCIDTSSCFLVNTVGINEVLDATSVILYPNPSNGSFYLSGINNMATLYIMDMKGIVVYNDNYINGKLIEPNLASGIYWVVIFNHEVNYSTKLIIQK